MADLVIYTDSFPYYNSETFLETEITYLAGSFGKVYIQPLNGEGVPRKLPANFILLQPLGEKNHNKIVIYLLGLLNIRLLFIEESFRQGLKEFSLLKAIKYLGYGVWVKRKIENNLIKSAEIHYSYWLNYNACALALLKREARIKTVISRAHRYDLFKGGGEDALDYIKLFTIKYLDKLFLISEGGIRYISDLYPQYNDKYLLSRLGTQGGRALNPVNTSGIFTLVSCSTLKPVKRVDIILDSLICLSKMSVDQKFIWYHLGSGESLEMLNSKASAALQNTNVQFCFKGEISNSEVYNFFKDQPVDLFLNVSEAEGIPVSIMEAQSFGIPVLATAVGSNHEIVNNENGYIIDVKINPEELAQLFYKISCDGENLYLKRAMSHANWKACFDAEINYKSFTSDLMDLNRNNN